MNKNFVVGFGFKYHLKQIIYSFPRESYLIDSGIYESIKPANYDVVSKQKVPSFFVKYVKEVNRFINIGIKGGVAYGNELIVGASGFGISHPYVLPNGEVESTYLIVALYGYNNIKFINMFLSPEVQLKFTKNIGVQLNFNMFNYTFTKTEKLSTTENSKDYDFNLNPSNWVMGVFFYFGNKKSTTKPTDGASL
ncbi:MAG: hypothetical protein IPO21_10950 [Bacteroidales bacterium]|nr:hypothetical protein [Bacteroidales bacterium]